MVQNCSKIRVHDNSGASIIRCFKNLKYQNNNKLDAIFKISVQELKVNRRLLVKKGQICNALLIKSKYNLPRFNGQKITFKENGCILLNNTNFKNKKSRNKITMIGSNVLGIALKEFRLYSIKMNINSINIL